MEAVQLIAALQQEDEYVRDFWKIWHRRRDGWCCNVSIFYVWRFSCLSLTVTVSLGWQFVDRMASWHLSCHTVATRYPFWSCQISPGRSSIYNLIYHPIALRVPHPYVSTFSNSSNSSAELKKLLKYGWRLWKC